MRARVLGAFVCLWTAGQVNAQTTAGLATTVVFPVAAQTVSFASEMTLFNPGSNLLTASVQFYEANNAGAPGPKVCNDVSVPAGRSTQISLATQCALTGSGSHFGLVVIADKAVPQVNAFYGYARIQNPQGIGFSVEGFPATNFNNQVGHATGLKRKAAAPTYQTNCFVGSLDQPVSYQLKLFNDSTGTQVGGTLAGSLTAFQQFRYLDVFGANGVNAPAGDLSNVRAEFTQTSGGSANLIGLCTVQDNTSFGADFRIAKSYGSPSSSFFAQGGNAFGTTAHLGTTDNQPLSLMVNNQSVATYLPNATSPNIVSGHSSNAINPVAFAQTIGGGGQAGTNCDDPSTFGSSPCSNRTTGNYATIGGGIANLAGDKATVAGGGSNTASGDGATVGGGSHNLAGVDSATVGGGLSNRATNTRSTVAGGWANVASGQMATVSGGVSNTASADYATVGGGVLNTASGIRATVAGGWSNTASGSMAMIVGGQSNTAGPFSFAAGYHANAQHTGCFVWADSTTINPASCNGNNEFIARAKGGFYFFTGGFSDATYTGAQLPAGAGGWSVYSDRAGKENLVSVETVDILEKLVSIPIATWNWKAQGEGIRHIGPMAQDFYAAFGVGHSDRTISTVDADGVALAAIQGLHKIVREKDAKIEAQQHRIEALEQRMASVDAMHDEVAKLRAAMSALAQDSVSLAATLH
jgi:hypothetical protein